MLAFIGCRTTRERRARGEGLTVFATNPGGWARRQLLPMDNPSFLALGPGGRTLYTVHGDGASVSALRIDGSSLVALGTQPTGGRNPVHLALDHTDRFLVVANYANGTVAALPVDPDGSLQPPCSLLDLPGELGPHRTDQAGSHPHQVLPTPDRRLLIVPDKGLDRVFTLSCDPGSGALKVVAAMASRPGAGPRHAAFHPTTPILYVLNELDSSLTTCRLDPDGGLTPLQVLPTLPSDFFYASTAAGIVATPCGRFVYASNRGHDSVAAFTVEPGDHTLRPLGWTASLGTTPRFITLDPSGTTLFVANETSDSINAFSINADGGLHPAGTVATTGSPVCILFTSKDPQP
ncbi:MAG: lactonase family protein [Janthinobacterium lividum]